MGFNGPMANSMDAVSARDFAMEYLAAAAINATHLSRLAEEIVFCHLIGSGLSGFLMLFPQDHPSCRKNVIRTRQNWSGKPGRITGAFITLLTVIKGLPMTYGKDMQEDKEPVFDASDHLGLAIAVMEGMIRDMTINTDAMRSALDAGFSTATDLADWIVSRLGLPFRDAHHITGQAVALAEQKQLRLDQLTVDDLQSVS